MDKQEIKRIRSLIDARIAQLRKGGDTPRNANECAAMEWDMHTGRIPKEDWPKGWKDPYAKLDKASKAKPKTTTKAKKK